MTDTYLHCAMTYMLVKLKGKDGENGEILVQVSSSRCVFNKQMTFS